MARRRFCVNGGSAAGRIGMGRFDNYAAVGRNLGEDGVDMVDSDVGEQSWLAGDFAGGVAVANIPAKYTLVEGSGIRPVVGAEFVFLQVDHYRSGRKAPSFRAGI